MRIALLLCLAGCRAASPTTPSRPCELMVLHLQRVCADIRSGWSGFHIFEITTGAHRGKTVTIGYGDGVPAVPVDNWAVASVALQPIPKPHRGWPNDCTEPSAQPITYDGIVDPAMLAVYSSEKAARAALAAKCD